MKAISLWQPWATLVSLGAKQYETRHWTTRYRGPLAIHAAKKRDREVMRYFFQEPFLSVLRAAGIPTFSALPLGAIVAIVDLTAIYDAAKLAPKISEQERAFGNYAAGRYAWRLENIRMITPIPFKGMQGLFEWEPPEDF